MAGNLKAAANIMRTGQRGILLNGFQRDSKGADATRADYAKKKAGALALVASMEPLLLTEEGRRLINQLKSDIERHAESFRQISDLCDTGKLKEAEIFYKEQGAPAGVAMEQTASEMMEQQIQIMRASAEAGHSQVRFAVISLTAIGVLGVITLLVTLFMVAGITKGLSRLSAELSEGAAQVQSASAQVATSSQRLAQEASNGAASIEETSAAAKEVAALARKSAGQAKTAANLMDTSTLAWARGIKHSGRWSSPCPPLPNRAAESRKSSRSSMR